MTTNLDDAALHLALLHLLRADRATLARKVARMTDQDLDRIDKLCQDAGEEYLGDAWEAVTREIEARESYSTWPHDEHVGLDLPSYSD